MKALAIGGTFDHLHALLALPSTMSFAKAVQLLKGGSSKWVHDRFPKPICRSIKGQSGARSRLNASFEKQLKIWKLLGNGFCRQI